MISDDRARIANYELEVSIDRPRETVWKALTQDTNAWWLPAFHMVGEGSTVTLRAEAGGQLLEKRESGGSLLWYTVHMVDPGNSIHLVGYSFPEWGGPGVTMLKLALEIPALAVFAISRNRLDALAPECVLLADELLRPLFEQADAAEMIGSNETEG